MRPGLLFFCATLLLVPGTGALAADPEGTEVTMIVRSDHGAAAINVPKERCERAKKYFEEKARKRSANMNGIAISCF